MPVEKPKKSSSDWLERIPRMHHPAGVGVRREGFITEAPKAERSITDVRRMVDSWNLYADFVVLDLSYWMNEPARQVRGGNVRNDRLF